MSFEDIVLKYYQRVLYFVKSIVKNDATAQDITQETFIQAYKSFGDYSEQGKTLAWLKAIARNTAFRYMQRENRYICINLNDCESITNYNTPENNIISNEGYRHILKIISHLPKHQQTVFYYRFVQDMPVNEVAKVLNLPIGSVKSKSYYGLKKVKQELKEYLIKGGSIMNCQKAYEYLFQYAKNAILAEDKAGIEKHLDVCNNCKDIAESLKKLVPNIKPAPKGILRHYNIKFQLDNDIMLVYHGLITYEPNYKKLNDVLTKTGGVIPDNETWFMSGFGRGTNHIAEFDNEGNHIEVEVFAADIPKFMHIKYKKMKKIFEYHETNSVVILENDWEYKKSLDAPNLYIAKTSNLLGQAARSGVYLAIPGKAKNIRIKQGVDIINCGAYQFIYDDRYITESQAVMVECTYNM